MDWGATTQTIITQGTDNGSPKVEAVIPSLVKIKDYTLPCFRAMGLGGLCHVIAASERTAVFQFCVEGGD